MRKLHVAAFVSMDGVMQAPGGPDEDPTGGFAFGGWVAPPGLPLDDAGVEALGGAGRAAWRDGRARVERLRAGSRVLDAVVRAWFAEHVRRGGLGLPVGLPLGRHDAAGCADRRPGAAPLSVCGGIPHLTRTEPD